MFVVELAGHGVVRDPGFPPYPVFVISVTQPFQSWTVYRRFSSFRSLGDHLRNTVGATGGLPGCPHMTDDVLMGSEDQLDRARVVLQQWLHQTLLFPGVKESQPLRNFLCASANAPPPRLEIRWASSHCPSLDEMQMDELFDRHLEDREDVDDVEEEDDHGEVSSAPADGAGQHQHRHEASVSVGVGCVGRTDDSMDQAGQSMELESRSLLRGGQRGYEPTGCDMPNEEDIASSVPIDITFMDPSVMQWGNNGASGNASSGSPSLPEERVAEAATADRQPGAGVAQSGGGGGAGMGGSGMGGGTPVALAKRKVGLDSFKIVRVIGKGSFGKVFLVREKVAGDIYAMKVLRKDNIIKRNQVEHTKTERNVLGYVKHPFIVGLNMAFQTRDKLFFVLDYCAGGELFFHLAKLGKFPEPRSRFYAAEITLALQHVHRLNIVYRDLKPENVLLDAEGHIRLTDFGLSKEGISNTTSGAHSFCGTPEYLAPEILNRQGHGRAVDWWSLGALLYEMVTGLPPFYCRDREKLFEKIRRGNLSYPRYLSTDAQAILQGLLTRDPSKRLGSSLDDAQEVQRHPFFAPLNWDRIMRREVAPPWEPTVVGSLDTSQFDREFTSMPIFSPDQRDYKLGQSSTSNDDTFEGFTFIDSSSHLHTTTTPPTSSSSAATIDPLSGSKTPTSNLAGTATTTPSPQPPPAAAGGGAAAAAAGAAAAVSATTAAAAVTVTPTNIRPQRLLVDHMDTPDV